MSGGADVPVQGLTLSGGGGGVPSGPAGGDLGGTYPNPLVVGFQGRPVAPTAPNVGDVYVWDGSQWVPTPGGVIVPASYADRADLSVNGGFVERFQEEGAIFRIKTNVNPTGGYNGGGTGNKAILGNYGFDGLLLSALTSLSWRSKNLTPLNVQPASPQYMSLIVELDPVGFPNIFAVFSLLNANPSVLQQGTITTPGPDETEVNWNAATDYTQVVSDRGMFAASLPIPWPGPGAFNAANLGVGAGNPPIGAWPARSYSWASIVASFPNARIRNANSLDGGMPNGQITAGVQLASGDSATFNIHERRLISWTLNGNPI